jgi:hypothetical protein
VNNFERVTCAQASRTVNLAGNDVSIELDDNTPGPNLQFLEQPGDAQAVANVSLFSVYTNLHLNKKPYPQSHLWWPGNTV